MEKIIIKCLIILVLLIVPTKLFFDKYEIDNSIGESIIVRNYKNNLIGVNKDNSISYNIYKGGITSPYQNEYFIEYSAKFKNNIRSKYYKKYNIKEKTAIKSKQIASNEIQDFKVVIKDKNNKVIYKTGNLVNLNKKLGKDSFFPEYMFLTMNDKKELIINIPTNCNLLVQRYRKYENTQNVCTNNKNNTYAYNLNTKKFEKFKTNNKQSGGYVIGNNLPAASRFVKFNNSDYDGVNSVIIFNGSEYYKTHKNAKIFKEFPKLKKYLETHKNVKQININFKDNISDDQIVEYLK